MCCSKGDPPYEPEEIGCTCTESGLESEWIWVEAAGGYECSGCGKTQ
jgi:hypothetical protein